MIEEMINRLVKLVRGAVLPTTLPQGELSFYGGWENKTDLTGAWLTQVIHIVRFEPLSHWFCAVRTRRNLKRHACQTI